MIRDPCKLYKEVGGHTLNLHIFRSPAHSPGNRAQAGHRLFLWRRLGRGHANPVLSSVRALVQAWHGGNLGGISCEESP